MKSLTEYILEGSQDYANLKWWQSQMEKIFDEAPVKVGDIEQYGKRTKFEMDCNYVLQLGIVDDTEPTNTRNYAARTFHTTSAGEGQFYLTILDSFKNYEFNKTLFDEIKSSGKLEEANNWRCSQWGTWKILIQSEKDAKLLIKIIKDCVNKYF